MNTPKATDYALLYPNFTPPLLRDIGFLGIKKHTIPFNLTYNVANSITESDKGRIIIICPMVRMIMTTEQRLLYYNLNYWKVESGKRQLYYLSFNKKQNPSQLNEYNLQ